VVLRSQPSKPLHVEPAQRTEGRPRRHGPAFHPGERSRPGQGGELVASAEWTIRLDDAALLAEGAPALASRWHLEAASNSESLNGGRLNVRSWAYCCPEPMRRHARSWRKQTLHRHRNMCGRVSA
jgi:hypothetical protein